MSGCCPDVGLISPAVGGGATTFFEEFADFDPVTSATLTLISSTALFPGLTGETWRFVLSHAFSQSVALNNMAVVEWRIQVTAAPTFAVLVNTFCIPGLDDEPIHSSISASAVIAVDNPTIQMFASRGVSAPSKDAGLGRILAIRDG